jgi:hypothetical protein
MASSVQISLVRNSRGDRACDINLLSGADTVRSEGQLKYPLTALDVAFFDRRSSLYAPG